MQQQDDREPATAAEPMTAAAPETVTAPAAAAPTHDDHVDTELDDQLVRTCGGLRYQQGHRQPGNTDAGAPRSSAPVGEPGQRQQAEDYGGPTADEVATLHQQGYPKLGRALPSRVTQVEHGPYAGGSQQGDTKPARES